MKNENDVKIGDNNIVFDFDPHAVLDSAFEEAVHAAADICHVADAIHAQRGQTSDVDQYIRCNGGFAFLVFFCHGFLFYIIAMPPSTAST